MVMRKELSTEFKSEIFDTFSHCPDIMELMNCLEVGALIKAKALMEDMIAEHLEKNSLKTLITSKEDISRHNGIVKTHIKMERYYADFIDIYLHQLSLAT